MLWGKMSKFADVPKFADFENKFACHKHFVTSKCQCDELEAQVTRIRRNVTNALESIVGNNPLKSPFQYSSRKILID